MPAKIKAVKYSIEAVLKNYTKWTRDKELLKIILQSTNKKEFTDSEIKKILEKEMKRKVK